MTAVDGIEAGFGEDGIAALSGTSRLIIVNTKCQLDVTSTLDSTHDISTDMSSDIVMT